MRYPQKTSSLNFYNATGSKDKIMQQDMIYSALADIIETKRQWLIDALQQTGTKVPKNITKKALINKVIFALFRNKEFKKLIDIEIATSYAPQKYLYSNGGDAGSTIATSTAQGSKGGWFGAIFGAVSGVTQSIFNYKATKNEQAAAEENARAALYNKLLGGNKKSLMPIIVIGGVLLIAGIVLFFTLKKKNA